MRKTLLGLFLLAGLATGAVLGDEARVVGPAGNYQFQVVTTGPTTTTHGEGWILIQWAGKPVPVPDVVPDPPGPDPKPDPKPDPTPVEPTAKGRIWAIYLYEDGATDQADVAVRAALSASKDLKALDARFMAVSSAQADYARWSAGLNDPAKPTTPLKPPAILFLDQIGNAKEAEVIDTLAQPKSVDDVLKVVKKLRGK